MYGRVCRIHLKCVILRLIVYHTCRLASVYFFFSICLVIWILTSTNKNNLRANHQYLIYYLLSNSFFKLFIHSKIDMKYILREITPLAKNSLFFTAHYPQNKMDFPLHFHEDFELCLALNARGKRIIKNRIEEFTEKDLILIGPNVLHCYKQEEVLFGTECEISIIQFDKDMYKLPIFSTKQLQHIRHMFIQARQGAIKFPEETVDKIGGKIYRLSQLKDSFEEVLLFFEIMNDLATSTNQRYINIVNQGNNNISLSLFNSQSKRINKITHFVENNYQHKISLQDIANLVNMSPAAVSRFFKRKTNHTFNEYLNSYRIDKAAQMLIETEKFISEICFSCGFNNVSNFNLVFRKQMKCTPNEYRTSCRTTILPQYETYL